VKLITESETVEMLAVKVGLDNDPVIYANKTGSSYVRVPRFALDLKIELNVSLSANAAATSV